MPASTSKYHFPPNVPDKLIEKFARSGGNYRALARDLGVNVAHVWNLLRRGREPRDKDIRRKLFLTGRPRNGLPNWVFQAVEVLANLEKQAPPSSDRRYDRTGRRVR